MFRKIVTELAYSPALAGDLSQYVKQLRDETSRRQIGLIFVLLAVTVQLLAALYPPESANANNPMDFFGREVQSVEQYLELYDENAANSKDLLKSLGITRTELASMEHAALPSVPRASIWSIKNTRTEDAEAHFFTASDGKTGIAYYQPLPPSLERAEAYVGSSSSLGGWFAITENGATLVTETRPAPACVEPLKIHSWSKADPCLSEVNQTLEARKISAGSPDVNQLQALDRVAYTLSIENGGSNGITIIPSIHLEDVLEYSRILDYGGGSYDFDTRNLAWKPASLPAGGSIKRTFIVQMLPTIPATAAGEYIHASYDCTVSASFGTSLSTPVHCPFVKQAERITGSLPRLASSYNVIAAVLLLAVTAFLYARSRQMLSELYIIRHNHLGGL